MFKPDSSSSDSSNTEVQGAITATSPVADQQVSTEASQDATSPSSSEPQGEKKPSALDVVSAAVTEGLQQKAAMQQATSEVDAPTAEKQEPEGQPPADQKEQHADDRFDKHPRFRELNAKVKEFGEKAERFDKLTTYLSESRLSTDDFARGLEIMRLIQTDPFAAYEAIRPIIADLELIVGHRLPDDLQDRVDRGLIDIESARELATTRTRQAMSDADVRRIRAQGEQEAQARAQSEQQDRINQLVDNVKQAASQWEADWKNSDPDYAKKLPLVMAQIHAIAQAEGFPSSPDQAVDQAKRARSAVEDHLKSILPGKRPTQPITGGGSGKTISRPGSALDVVRNAIG